MVPSSGSTIHVRPARAPARRVTRRPAPEAAPGPSPAPAPWCAPDSSARIPSPGKRARMASRMSASDRWSTSVTTSRADLWSIVLDALVALRAAGGRPAPRSRGRTRASPAKPRRRAEARRSRAVVTGRSRDRVRGVVPRLVTTESKVSSRRLEIGLSTNAVSGPMPRERRGRRSGRSWRPALVPAVGDRDRAPGGPPGSATTPVSDDGNGPTPADHAGRRPPSGRPRCRSPGTRSRGACEAAGALRPSGLHRSHIDSAIGMRAPQRTQPCSGSAGAEAAPGAGVVGIGVSRRAATARSRRSGCPRGPRRGRRRGCARARRARRARRGRPGSARPCPGRRSGCARRSARTPRARRGR